MEKVDLEETLNNSDEQNVKCLCWKCLNPPNVEMKVVEQNLLVKAIYELPFKVTMENWQTWLFSMKLKTYPSCDCGSQSHENLLRLR